LLVASTYSGIANAGLIHKGEGLFSLA